MSHYTVTVRLPSTMPLDRALIDQAVEDALEPYYETCDTEHESVEFDDVTDKMREQYNARCDEDPEFRKKYLTFASAATEYWDCTENPDEPGRFGYYRNPQAKWDWYNIGGRWHGHFKIKTDNKVKTLPGVANPRHGTPSALDENVASKDDRVDICRISEIDWDYCDQTLDNQMKEMWKDYETLVNHAKDDGPLEWNPFQMYHIVSSFTSMGIVTMLEGDKIPTAEANGDLLLKLNDDIAFQIEDKYMDADNRDEVTQLFINSAHPLVTYAFLDSEKGWAEAGEMGWFGSGADVDEQIEYNKAYLDWIQSGDEDDWIVVVDLHI